MTNLLPDEAALHDAYKKSTQGEWLAENACVSAGEINCIISNEGVYVLLASQVISNSNGPRFEANCHAIALAHNLTPTLLDRISALRGRVAELEKFQVGAEDEIKKLQAWNAQLRSALSPDIWYWDISDEGANDIQSLVCAIRIEADDMRTILSERDALREQVALLKGEVRRCWVKEEENWISNDRQRDYPSTSRELQNELDTIVRAYRPAAVMALMEEKPCAAAKDELDRERDYLCGRKEKPNA